MTSSIASAQWTAAQASQTIAQWRALLHLPPPENVRQHTTLYAQGDPPRDFFLIARGIVKLVLHLPNGNESLLGLRYPGHLLGSGRNIGFLHPVSAIAVLPSQIHRIDAARLYDAARRDPDIAFFQAQVLQRDLHDLALAHLGFKVLSAQERLEHALWEIAAVLGTIHPHGQANLILPFDHTDLAALCGLSESHYRTVRKRLERQGRVTRNGPRRLTLTLPKQPSRQLSPNNAPRSNPVRPSTP